MGRNQTLKNMQQLELLREEGDFKCGELTDLTHIFKRSNSFVEIELERDESKKEDKSELGCEGVSGSENFKR